MFGTFRFNIFDDVLEWLCRDLVTIPFGDRVSSTPLYETKPRGQLVKEMIGVTFVLTNPRARLCTLAARKANYGFAAGEFCWYLRGAEDLESIAYYNPRMKGFSDDGKKLHSAYGRRLLAHPPNRPSQWADVISTLKQDRDSRRAVMTIYAPSDMRRAVDDGTKDVPCTLALQFFIRDNRLHLHVTMRSNDVIWGLTNDLFSFTLLQETMLLDLREAGVENLELGEYIHTAGSMHIYERHFKMASEILADYYRGQFPAPGETRGAMPAIATRADLDELLRREEALRLHGKLTPSKLTGGAAWLYNRLVEHRALKTTK